MLDTPEKKLPSFSNEPQTFANMTLFLSQRYGLALHVNSGVSGIIREGESLQGLANYYLNYFELERKRFEPLARTYLRSVNTSRVSRGEEPYNSEEEKNFLDKCCQDIASIMAGNCEDSHDLSSEFCSAAKGLGAELQARVNAGVKKITIIQSYSPATNFMKPQHG